MAHQSTPPECPVIAIIGATGTGKSQLAVELARDIVAKHGRVCEVINADAMQMYAGLPIITNKITTAEQMGVRHHLLGCVGVADMPWRVGEFVKEARKAMASVHERGGVPVLVGGTHYYLQSLLFDRGLVGDPEEPGERDGDGALAKGTTIELPELDEMTTEQLHTRLQEVDPIMAARWHPNDRRKIRRSLEIWLQTGRQASTIYADQQRQDGSGSNAGGDEITRAEGLTYPSLIFWMHTERDALVARLNKRVDKMFASGLLDEVSQLNQVLENLESKSEQEVDQTRGIWVSIGFKQFSPYFERLRQGSVKHSELKQLLDAGLEETKGATRQYAKSQLKWIRIKLLLALRDVDATGVLWPLSTDHVAEEGRWATDVAAPASKLTAAFLRGNPLPSQKSELSPNLLELLEPTKEYDTGKRRDLWVTKTCDICNVTATTAVEWDKHVNGNRHTKLIKKRRQREERARSIPRPRQQTGSQDEDFGNVLIVEENRVSDIQTPT